MMRYGSLTVLSGTKPRAHGNNRLWVRCDCGSERFTTRITKLRQGKITGCKRCVLVAGAKTTKEGNAATSVNRNAEQISASAAIEKGASEKRET